MKKISLIIYVFLLIWQPVCSNAQNSNLPLNSDLYHAIDRFELISNQFYKGLFTNQRPFNRAHLAHILPQIDSISQQYYHSEIDDFYIQTLKNEVWETLTNDKSTKTGKSFLKYFYQYQADFYGKKTKDFDIHINPIIHFSIGRENPETYFSQNTRGLEIRGSLNQKIAFYSQFTENQVILPSFQEIYRSKFNTLPGEGYYKTFGNAKGWDYLAGRGYINFKPIKSLDITFGHDKHFVGSGIRSMILSDFSSPYLFLKINTQVGGFQYQNLFAQLVNRQAELGFNQKVSKKYLAAHHVSYNITKKLNLGLRETIVFGQNEKFELNYLNPVILYRYSEFNEGSPDNAILSLDFKCLALKNTSVYGQLVLDEFKLNSIKAQNGAFTNKAAYQIGFKWVDMFKIDNLDIQLEHNAARPYTYSHFNSASNYVHYNAPLAHPLGANFKEYIGILRLQYNPKMLITNTLSVSNYGVDRPGQNWGGNILNNYISRPRDFNNYIGQGINTNLVFNEFRISYQLLQNMHFDFGLVFRKTKNYLETKQETMPRFAFRWNMPYRQNIF